MNAQYSNKTIYLIICSIVFSVIFIPAVNSEGSLYLQYGQTLTLTGCQTYSTITGAGRNSLIIENASLYVNSIKLSGAYNSILVIKNSTITGLSGGMTFSSYINAEICNVSVKNFAVPCTVLILRGLRNSTITNFDYIYSTDTTSTNLAAISIEACQNLLLDNVRGIGIANVKTPHFHTSFAGSYQSLNVTIANSYFYGGGNGGTTSNVLYRNCTWERVTDGTEYQKAGITSFENCNWINTSDSEINLQNGVVYTFTNCTFSKGLVNMSNGLAKLINCTYPSLTFAEMRDNNGQLRYLGKVDYDGHIASWEKVKSSYAVKISP